MSVDRLTLCIISCKKKLREVPMYVKGKACWSIWECLVTVNRGVFAESNPFRVYLYFPYDYPQVPPMVHFIFNFFHPNIGADGFMKCTITTYWNPNFSINILLYDVALTLSKPKLDLSINHLATSTYLNNQEEYVRIVRQQFQRRDEMKSEERQKEEEQLEIERELATESRQFHLPIRKKKHKHHRRTRGNRKRRHHRRNRRRETDIEGSDP